MDIYKILEDYFDKVNITYDENTINILFIFAGIVLFTVILRIIVSSGYQTQYIIFQYKSKPKKDKPIKKSIKPESKMGIMSKVLIDYKLSSDTGISRISTRSIIKKHLYKLNFLGWAYPSMEKFVLGFEQGIMFIGVLLTLFLKDKEIYAITTIIMFLIVRILASIFDFSLSREKLLEELTEYVEREVTNDTNADINTSISRLRVETYTAIIKQGEILKESIDKLGANLTGALALSISEMTKTVEVSVINASRFSESLQKPLENWVETIKEASIAQEKINIAYDSLSDMVLNLNNASGKLGSEFTSYSTEANFQTTAVKEQIELLVKISEELLENNKSTKQDTEMFRKDMKYIEKNQLILEQSLEKYEVSLENVTTKIGDALGSIVEVQMHNSYDTLNEEVQDNIGKIINSNSDLLKRLQELFEKLQEQSRTETQAILKLQEQTEMNFEYLREKIM